EVFERDLRAAFDTETRVAVFDFRSVRDARAKGEAFVSAIVPKEAERGRQAVARATAILPSDRRAGMRLDAYLSFGVPGLADHPGAKEPAGRTIWVVALARVLGESDAEPLASRVTRVARLMAGEAFRQAWHVYRVGSPAWNRPDPGLGQLEPLFRVVA